MRSGYRRKVRNDVLWRNLTPFRMVVRCPLRRSVMQVLYDERPGERQKLRRRRDIQPYGRLSTEALNEICMPGIVHAVVTAPPADRTGRLVSTAIGGC
jgi:hypothetical protein